MYTQDDLFFQSLRSIVKKMHCLGARAMVPYGLSHAEMRMLLLLYAQDGCSQDDLVSKQSIDRTNVGRALKKLESLGFVRRAKDSGDRRMNIVHLTDKGKRFKSYVLEAKRRIEKRLIDTISPQEYSEASRILSRIDAGFRVDDERKE